MGSGPGSAAPVLRAPSPASPGEGTGPSSFADPRSAARGGGKRRGGKAPRGHRALPRPQLAHLSPGSPAPRGGRRGGERVATPAGLASRLRAPVGRRIPAALGATAGSLPVPAPHFLRGPARGAGARPTGQVGVQVGAQAGGAWAGREEAPGRAACVAVPTWPAGAHVTRWQGGLTLGGRGRHRPRTAHPARGAACGFGEGVARL